MASHRALQTAVQNVGLTKEEGKFCEFVRIEDEEYYQQIYNHNNNNEEHRQEQEQEQQQTHVVLGTHGILCPKVCFLCVDQDYSENDTLHGREGIESLRRHFPNNCPYRCHCSEKSVWHLEKQCRIVCFECGKQGHKQRHCRRQQQSPQYKPE